MNIIDSLELNGGSTFFLEFSAGMKKYTDNSISTYIVSKSGGYGRSGLVDPLLPLTYGVDLEAHNYRAFEELIIPRIRNATVFHHVLGFTKPIKFHRSCKYIVINHTLTNMKRLQTFHPYAIVSVCGYFASMLMRRVHLSSRIILNGCEDYFDTIPCFHSEKFVVGCCQRLPPSKFNMRHQFPIGCLRYVVGPGARNNNNSQYNFIGPVFDKIKKLQHIKSFDVYLHDAKSPEGASMAILESLSCGVPVLVRMVGGGTSEIIKNGINGFFYGNDRELNRILVSLMKNNKKKLIRLKEKTRDDFLKKFHIKKVIRQYERIASVG